MHRQIAGIGDQYHLTTRLEPIGRLRLNTRKRITGRYNFHDEIRRDVECEQRLDGESALAKGQVATLVRAVRLTVDDARGEHAEGAVRQHGSGPRMEPVFGVGYVHAGGDLRRVRALGEKRAQLDSLRKLVLDRVGLSARDAPRVGQSRSQPKRHVCSLRYRTYPPRA